MTQALGIVHVFVPGKATKYRLPEQTAQYMPDRWPAGGLTLPNV
jgi:hypothetical protein